MDISALSPRDLDEFVGFLYDRFFDTRALLGTPESAAALAARLYDAGVDEIACLIDFGPPTADVLESLPHLARLKDARSRATGPSRRSSRTASPVDLDAVRGRCDQSLPADVFYGRLAARGVSFGAGAPDRRTFRSHRRRGARAVARAGDGSRGRLRRRDAGVRGGAALVHLRQHVGRHLLALGGRRLLRGRDRRPRGVRARDDRPPRRGRPRCLHRIGDAALRRRSHRRKGGAVRGDARRAGARDADLARPGDARLAVRGGLAAQAARIDRAAGRRPLAGARRCGRRGNAAGGNAARTGKRGDAGAPRGCRPARSGGDRRARRSRRRRRGARGRRASLEPRRRSVDRLVARAHSCRRAARPRHERASDAGAGRLRPARTTVDRHARRGVGRGRRGSAGRRPGAGVGLRARGGARISAALGRTRRSRSGIRARSGERRRGDRPRAGGRRRRRPGGVARGAASRAAPPAQPTRHRDRRSASSRARPISSPAASAASGAASRTGW